MRQPSYNHYEHAWKFCFFHMVEVQDHFESHWRKPCASPTIGRNEKNEQTTENSNSGSALPGFAFPNLGSLTEISSHCKAGYCCAPGPQGFKFFWPLKSKGPGRVRADCEIRHLIRKMVIANPELGCTQDSWRIAEAGFRGFRTKRIEPDAQAFDEFKAISDLADFSEKPCKQMFDCSFYYSDSRLQHSVCSGDPLPQPTQSRPFQHNLKPECRPIQPSPAGKCKSHSLCRGWVGYLIVTSGKKRSENINQYETIKQSLLICAGKRSQSKSSP